MRAKLAIFLFPLVSLTSGCMVEPFDGQKVASTTTRITFTGFVPDGYGVGSVQVQGYDPSAAIFLNAGSPAPVSGAFIGPFHMNWRTWTTTTPLSGVFWQPAESGFFAKVRAVTDNGFGVIPFGEGGYACIGRHESDPTSNVLEMVDDCESPDSVITICTNDYRQAGSRRGACRRRTLDRIEGTVTEHRLFLGDTTQTFVASDFDHVDWRGDGASFVDVFDEDLSETAPTDAIISHGAAFANYVRFYYPFSKTSDAFAHFDLNALVASVPPATPWRGAHSLRQYDEGECSTVVPWRDLFNLVLDAYPSLLGAASSGGVSVFADTSAELDPILRTGATDGLRFAQGVAVNVAGGLQYRVLVSAEGGLSVVDNLPHLTVEQFDLQILSSTALADLFAAFGGANVDDLRRQWQASLGPAVEQSVNALIHRAGIPPVVKRVFARPEGFEFVVVDSVDDPLYAALSSTAFCARTDGLTSTSTGHYDAFFDVE